MVMLGTKWPSITSTWIQSAPAASTARTSSPSRAKSAARIDGAISRGRCIGQAPGRRSRIMTARERATRRASGNSICGGKVNRELREAEIEPGRVRQRAPVAASIRPILRLAAVKPSAKARSRPAAANTSAVEPRRTKRDQEGQCDEADHQQRIGRKRAAIPSMTRRRTRTGRSRSGHRSLALGFDPGCARQAPDDRCGERRAGEQREQLERRAPSPKSSARRPQTGERTPARVNGVATMHRASVASVSAASRPSSATKAGAAVSGAERGLQHECEEQAGRALTEADARKMPPSTGGVTSIIQAVAASTSPGRSQ